MAIGERFRSGGTHGIATFLADHQRCDAGFDVRREDQPGSGKLKITCEGCGQSVSYRAADAVDLAAGTLGAPANGDASTVAPDEKPPATAKLTPRRRTAPVDPPAPPPPTPTRGRGPDLPSWVPIALISALILGGLGMIIAGLISSDDGGETASEPEATSTQAAEPQEATPPAERPAEAGEAKSPADDGGEGAADVNLERTRVAGVFAIGVPSGWQRDEAEGGGVSIRVRDGSAEIRVFYEPGERPTGQLAGSAAGFLADEHRGAEVSRPESVRVDHARGAEITAVYGGGEETAVVVSKGGFAFLILCRVDRGAAPQREAEAEAIMDSFDAQS